MKNQFSFEEEFSSFVRHTFITIYVFLYIPGGILVLNSLMRKNLIEFSLWSGLLIAVSIFPYVLYVSKMEHSFEIVKDTLYFNNKRGKHIKALSLCDLDMSALIPLEKEDIEEYVSKNRKVMFLFKAKSNGSLVLFGQSFFSFGFISVERAIAFQHWLIEHIKENCPEEVYKEAMQHRIEI